MKHLLLILTIAVGYNLQAQDSVTLEVLSSKEKRNKIRYEFLIKDTGEIVYSYCDCSKKKDKGELIRVAKKDLQFIKPKE